MLDPIENLLNRQLADSPRARELALALRGRRLDIEIEDLALRIGVESAGHSLLLRQNPEGNADATVAGRPLALLSLARSRSERGLQASAVRVSGDAEVLQAYQQLLGLLQPDAEEWLARQIGDLPARQAARVARSIMAAGRRSLEAAVTHTAEYFAHETGDLVPRGEAEVFLAAVDRLREDVDRASARLDALTRRIAECTP